MSELNQWEQSIVDRLRYGLQHNQSVTLGADEVHIPMNAIIERGMRRAQLDQLPGSTKLMPAAPLTLEVAIEHAKERAASLGNCLCAAEHAQLAEWLEELAFRRAQPDNAPLTEGDS